VAEDIYLLLAMGHDFFRPPRLEGLCQHLRKHVPRGTVSERCGTTNSGTTNRDMRFQVVGTQRFIQSACATTGDMKDWISCRVYCLVVGSEHLF